MSLEKIIKEALDKNPLEMKDAFAEEMASRIGAALEEKYKSAMQEDLEEAKDDDDEDKDDDDDEDDDEDSDDDKNESISEDELLDMIESMSEDELVDMIESISDETLEEGPFKGLGKMMMKRKLNKASKNLDKAYTDASSKLSNTRIFDGGTRNPEHGKASNKVYDINRKQGRIQRASDRLDRSKNAKADIKAAAKKAAVKKAEFPFKDKPARA